MMSKQSLAQLLTVSHKTVMVLGGAYVIYKLSQLYGATDKIVDKATAPAGQLLSDVSARLNGWSPVQQTDLVIQPWYLDDNYKISDEAWDVLTVMDNNRIAMKQLFSGRIMKPEYRLLIGKPIGSI
jgi:hypothetical protein